MVSIGHEGRIGTEGMKLFEEIHADKNTDYLTIHIWAKNWNWFGNGSSKKITQARQKSSRIIGTSNRRRKTQKTPCRRRIRLAARRAKLFFDSPTTLRDDYYE